MPFWLEVRCARMLDRNRVWNPERGRYEGCESYDELEYGEGLTGDNVKDLLKGKRWIERRIRKAGWRRTRDGWVCPYCHKKGGKE